MTKSTIRRFVLDHAVTRELFFFFGRRKANLAWVDRALTRGNVRVSGTVARNVIVSLTSYGERMPQLKYTLYSLVVQSVRPERIVVNVAFEDEAFLSDELRTFQKYGVEFFFCKNVRSYKKLLPTLCRFPGMSIVTCDDDLFYGKNWLKKLCAAHREHPHDVCCHLVYRITHEGGSVSTYQKWVHGCRARTAEWALFLLGGSGVLYPPETFHRDITDERLFLRLAPLADDMWFYFMAVLNGRTIRQVRRPDLNLCFVNPYREYGISSGTTLAQQNVGENKNDVQFRAILAHYGISEAAFIDFLEGRRALTDFV